jgi:hypothetical protein
VVNVAAWCGIPGAEACARSLGDTCTIYLSGTADRCTVLHELTHCAGYDHPNFASTNPGCFLK